MSKQKLVIKFANDKKTRLTAMKTAVTISGVESVSLKEGQIEVVGVGVDAAELINMLREKFGETRCCGVIQKDGYAELISMTPVKKEEGKDSKEPDGKIVHTKVCQCGYDPCRTPMYLYPLDHPSDPHCSIM